MSFFKDIKDELEQAVNDIDTAEQVETEEEEDLFALASEDTDAEMDDELLADMLEEEEETTVVEEPAEEPVKESVAEEKPVVRERVEDKDALTVITKGTTINGSIISDCSYAFGNHNFTKACATAESAIINYFKSAWDNNRCQCYLVAEQIFLNYIKVIIKENFF